eukprot:m.105365 g.105365  ORF g.105365 m.105365 type:complete len:730 (-) comp13872_c0_seq1:120-2309(-)
MLRREFVAPTLLVVVLSIQVQSEVPNDKLWDEIGASRNCPTSYPKHCPAQGKPSFQSTSEKSLFEKVCQRAGTESPKNRCAHVPHDHHGNFTCQCCGQPLFDVADKCESTTGWPSFSKTIGACIKPTGEVVCSKCGAHLGDYFNDPGWHEGASCYHNGVPARFCIDGICLKPEFDSVYGTSCTVDPCSYSDAVYFGNGPFSQTQYDFYGLERQAPFNRNINQITAIAGYAGSTREGSNQQVCYKGASNYGQLGHAEAVQVFLDPLPDMARDQFKTLVSKFFTTEFSNNTNPAYRSIIGIPGGMSGPYFSYIADANVNNLRLVSANEQMDEGLVYIYDSNEFGFYKAEQSHQYYKQDGYSNEYTIDVKSSAMQRKYVTPTCDEEGSSGSSNKVYLDAQCSLFSGPNYNEICPLGTNVYFGDGCFWHTQYDFYKVEREAPFNRSPEEVTAVTGYAGGKGSGPEDQICYHNGPRGTYYGDFDYAEAAMVKLDPGHEKEQFEALASKFFEEGFHVVNGKWSRWDPQDAGIEYRSIIGVPQGVEGPYFELIQKANIHNMTLLEGAGFGDLDYYGPTVYIYDSLKFPFYRAEQYHQFHPNWVMQRDLPNGYSMTASRAAKIRGIINMTCGEPGIASGVGLSNIEPACQKMTTTQSLLDKGITTQGPGGTTKSQNSITYMLVGGFAGFFVIIAVLVLILRRSKNNIAHYSTVPNDDTQDCELEDIKMETIENEEEE